GAEPDLAIELIRHARDDLVVATAHAKLLVRGAEEPQSTTSGIAEEVEDVERGLVGDVGPELRGVGDVQQLAEIRLEPARDVAGDPLSGRDAIELDRLRLVPVVQGGVAGLAELLLQRRV